MTGTLFVDTNVIVYSRDARESEKQDRCTYGEVTVLNPFTTGVAEARASYEAAPVSVRRYRARGRPKRAA